MLNILKIGGNEAFYILKAFCACWVVFLHLPGISKESLLFLPFLRIAVPCFFMISGYYLVSNNDKNCFVAGRGYYYAAARPVDWRDRF